MYRFEFLQNFVFSVFEFSVISKLTLLLISLRINQFINIKHYLILFNKETNTLLNVPI